jgi:hypothetical protein
MDRSPLEIDSASPDTDSKCSSTKSLASDPLAGPLGAQPFSPIFTVAARMPLLALGVFSMAALGCAQSGVWTDSRDADDASTAISAVEAADRAASMERSARRVDRRGTEAANVLAQEDSASASSASSSSEGFVDALAATYAADMAALAEMQRARRSAAEDVIASQSIQTPENRGIPTVHATPLASAPAPVAAFAAPPKDGFDGSSQPVKPLVRTTPVSVVQRNPPTVPGAATGAATPAPSSAAPVVAAAPAVPATPPIAAAPVTGPAEAAAAEDQKTVAPTEAATDWTDTPFMEGGAATVLTDPTTTTVVNGALQLPPPTPPAPTTTPELAKLLAESLAKQSAESSAPLREWLAFAALAVTNPSLELPADFAVDLLPSERERVEKAHAGFAALGAALAGGAESLDRAVADRLIAALTGGPKLTIPKVALCTRVEGFGRYTPLANQKFLARANTRFIVYTELAGFTSDLADGNFVTRLATRVSIQSERDGIDVWQRSPEWTPVVDSSGVRRSEFFLCEIVPMSEYLSVGSYQLKVEVRDESTGAIATSTVPIHIVADPAMAAVTN